MYLEFICPPTPNFITAGSTIYRPGDVHERRILKETFDLIVMNEGTLYIQEDERQYTLNPGDFLILIPNHLSKGFRPCSVEVRFNWLHFSFSGAFKYPSVAKHLKTRQMTHKQYYKRESSSVFIPQNGHLNPETCKLITNAMDRLIEVKINHYYRQKLFLKSKLGLLESTQLLLYVLSLMEKKEFQDGSGNLSAQIYTYMATHSKQPFSLDEIAKKFSYHKAYIIKVMKDTYSMTPAQLHAQFRMKDAKILLETTDLPIQEIAAEVGYADAAYFCKQFKKYVNATPKEYRNKKLIHED